jgi:hypothetical protein
MKPVSNPWLAIPLTDYEQHMDSVEVQQLGILAELFAAAVIERKPNSIAILGIAGGNGLEHIKDHGTRIVGFDVNPRYLETVRERYPLLSRLELHCIDLAETLVDVEPVELVHAALIFEHAGIDRCLENALSLVAPGGFLSVILQIPSETEQSVSPSRFSSIQSLSSHFSFVDPASLRRTLAGRQFRLRHDQWRSLPGGKRFWMGIFERELL